MNKMHVVADSISMHYGPYLESYSAPYYDYSRKEKTIGTLENSEGVNGGDSFQVLSYLQRCIDQNMYWDLLVLNCGLHDIRCRPNLGLQVNSLDYERNLRQIFEISNKIANQKIWIRTTPIVDELHNSLKSDYKRYNADVIKYNEIADRLVASQKIRRVDLYSFCLNLGGAELRCDHIHFTEEVRRLQGAFVAGHLVAFLQ